MQAHLNTIQSAFNQDALLSDDNFNLKNSFAIYPNPNKGTFNVQFSEIVSDYSVQVVDQMGRVVFNVDFTNQNNLTQTIALNSASSGMYFVVVKSNDSVATTKIIVN